MPRLKQLIDIGDVSAKESLDMVWLIQPDGTGELSDSGPAGTLAARYTGIGSQRLIAEGKVKLEENIELSMRSVAEVKRGTATLKTNGKIQHNASDYLVQ